MIEGIFSQYGLAGLFGTLLVILVISERLIPRRTHLRFCKMYEDTISFYKQALSERERQVAVLMGHAQPEPTTGVGAGSPGQSD